MRRTEFQGSTKTIAATTVQTITWNPSDIPAAGIVALHFAFSGGTDVADIARVRVRAAGSTIVDVGMDALRAMVQRLSSSTFQIPQANNRFTLPLNIPDAPSPDLADVCQAPRNAGLQVELLTTAGTAAGQAILGYTITSVDARLYPTLQGSAIGAPLGASQFKYQFTADGAVCGFGIPVRGVGTARMVLGGVEVFNLSGPTFQTLDAAAGAGFDLITESQQLDDGGVFTTGSNRFLRLAPLSAPQGSSYLVIDTPNVTTAGNDWGGAAEELTLWSLVSQS